MLLMMASMLVVSLASFVLDVFKSKHDKMFLSLTTMTVLCVCYTFICFDMLDVETNFTAGYAPISVTSIYIAFVLCTILLSTLKAMRRSCQIRFAKRAAKRQAKSFKAALR